MLFHKVEPNETFSLGRWLSSEGHWNLGFRQMLFGVRVSLYKTETSFFALDYCAGSDSLFQLQLLGVMTKILERYPESVEEHVLQADFPRFYVKPINLDPTCWEELKAMSGLIDLKSVRYHICQNCKETTYNPDYLDQQFCRYCYTYWKS